MCSLLPRTRLRAFGGGARLPALVLLAVISLVVSSVPPSHAGGRLVGGAVPVGPAPADLNQEYNVSAFEPASSHKVHLPMLFRDHYVYPDSALGVQVSGTNASLRTKLVNMGAQWVRLRLSWSDIEPVDTDPGDYLWSLAFEWQLARLADQGVSIIVTLMDNPEWAAANPGGPLDPDVDIGELVEFMEAVVARYGAPPYEVKYWEFYNEPDNGVAYFGELREVGYFGNQPEAYAALLQAVYAPIKAVDPEAQIVFGGIAYDAFDVNGGPFVKAFLDGVLANGGGDYFDVMNFHYYPAFAPDWEAYGIDILGKYNYLRDKLASYGVHKPFICTETSTWSDAANGGSHELQSRYVAQVFVRSMAAGFRFTIWFKFIDDDELGTHKTGLLDPDFEPKPAYWAYQTLARQLGGAAFVRTWTEAETGSPLVEAYEFEPGQGVTWSGGTARIVAAWHNDEEGQEYTLVVPAAALVQVDKYGSETLVHDGDDGQVDGLIHLALGPSPVYLRLPE